MSETGSPGVSVLWLQAWCVIAGKRKGGIKGTAPAVPNRVSHEVRQSSPSHF